MIWNKKELKETHGMHNIGIQKVNIITRISRWFENIFGSYSI